jgi:hypothetical protein
MTINQLRELIQERFERIAPLGVAEAHTDAIMLKVQEYVDENQSNALDTILVDGHNIHYKDKNYTVLSVETNDSNPVDTQEPNTELSENEQ